MNEERRRYIEANVTEHLTTQELKDGWFFCCEWDEMLINKNDIEAESCTCKKKGDDK